LRAGCAASHGGAAAGFGEKWALSWCLRIEGMTERKASCSCGQLSATTRGEPVRISVCHCLACQRRTGSAFGAQARFPTEDVEVSGDSNTWTRTADSGNTLTYHFCPVCGAIVWYGIDSVPEVTAVPLGAFADPAFPAPRVSVYTECAHGWVNLPEEIVRE
jgi:hypothetical protein